MGESMNKALFSIYLMMISIIILFLVFFSNQKIKNVSNAEYNNISYFNKEYIPRYNSYKKTNPKKSIEDIVTEVNIGLDNPFYSKTNEVKKYSKSMLVNKYNYLNKDYKPYDLVIVDNTKLSNIAKNAFYELKNAAKKENLNIIAISGYRSYSYQEVLYNKYLTVDGKEKADTYSARPGFSEHQTGLAVDVSNGKTSYMNFENTNEFIWMNNNAHKYGFILRYPKGKEKITGYIYESWHYRYVGTEISLYIKKHNITFDEYYVKYIEPFV